MPNSVLWVCLVAVWLFVLVPMVLKGRPQMRKTTDAAKATRLLHRGGTKARSTSRRASGAHPHDPSYQRSERKRASVQAAETAEPNTTVRTAPTATLLADRDDADIEDLDTDDADIDENSAESDDVSDVRRADGAGVKAPVADTEQADTEQADGDGLSDEDEEVTVTGEIVDPESESDTSDLGDIVDAEEAEVDEDLDDDHADDEYDADDYEDDLDDDFSDLEEFENPRTARGDRSDDYDDDLDDDYDNDAEYEEYEDDDADEVAQARPSAGRRRRGVYVADRRQIALKYRERQRVAIGLFVLMVAGIVSGVMLGTVGWVIAGVTVAMFVVYLGYLRRAVAVERTIRAQRAARAKRQARQDAERRRRTLAMEEFDRAPTPARMRRPGGATVLEIDDEDPVFDHLPPFQRRRIMREQGEFREVS